MKTFTKVAIGLTVVSIGWLTAFLFMKSKLSPWDKMYLDVMTPGTSANTSQAGYNRGNGYNLPSGLVDAVSAKSFVEYRKGTPTDPFSIAYNKKTSWGKSEIVPV